MGLVVGERWPEGPEGVLSLRWRPVGNRPPQVPGWLLENRDRVLQREPDARLCRDFDVLLARCGRRAGPGARADGRADRRALAAAGDPANQRAHARSARDRRGVALLMACAGPHVDRRLDRMPLALHVEGVERDPELRVTFEVARR